MTNFVFLWSDIGQSLFTLSYGVQVTRCWSTLPELTDETVSLSHLAQVSQRQMTRLGVSSEEDNKNDGGL